MDLSCLPSIPSLEFLSCAKIALAVFYNHDVYQLAFHYPLPSTFLPRHLIQDTQTRMPLKTVLDVAIKKTATLKMPTKHRKRLKSFILNMIHELRLWKMSLQPFLDINKLKNIRPFWTKHLTIDQVKTTKALIETLNLDAVVSFQLTCKFCLFDDALNLWSNMTRQQKKPILLGLHNSPPLEAWFRDSEFEESQKDMESFITFLESWSICPDEYVMPLVLPTKSLEDQAYMLRTAARNTSLFNFQPDFKRKCLQQLDKAWQEQIIKRQPFFVLRCLLTWPFENNFLDVANSLWNDLTPRQFYRIVETFIDILETYEWQNLELTEILKKFWIESPERLKYFTRRAPAYDLLKVVLNCNSLESIDTNKLEEAYQYIVASKEIRAWFSRLNT